MYVKCNRGEERCWTIGWDIKGVGGGVEEKCLGFRVLPSLPAVNEGFWNGLQSFGFWGCLFSIPSDKVVGRLQGAKPPLQSQPAYVKGGA